MTARATFRRPKVLCLGFDIEYLNPTPKMLVEAIRATSDAHFFGPGYQASEIIDRGLDNFLERFGPFDIVLADEFALQDFSPLARGEEMRFINHACRFDRRLLALGKEFQEFLSRCHEIRIIGLMQSDYYNFTERRIDQLKALGDHFIAWGPELISSMAERGSGELPTSTIDADIVARWTDRYLEFAQACNEQVISCPHIISISEVGGPPLTERGTPWACLGADYRARVVARDRLDRAGLVRSGQWMPKAFSIAGRLKFNPYNKYWSIALAQWGFRRALRQARFAFTCGSILHWPIRKYFEIPANGGVLVCEKPKGFETLGFVDRVNSVVCDAEDILEADAWLSSDEVQAQEIATAGQDLIIAKHTVEARGRQIGSAFQRILDGTFRGSRWCKGEFQLL